jgi:hypothetical protein
MTRIFAIAALFCSFLTLNSFAQDNVKETHIRQLMNMMGSGQLGVQIIKNMMATYKKSMPDVDPKNDPDAPAHHPGIYAGRRGMGETAEREDHATPQGKGLSQKFLIMPS